MSDQSLLSKLCSICNTNEFKYRCPGCAARTCSLPCYKRHQQWAQCSGQRDPTKFVKKSQLVTPAGIDHDYNFLSGIERNLEKAERAASATGAVPSSDAVPKGQRGGINYHRLESTGVKVIRAPQGLSRHKENKSHQSSTKKAKQNFVWTVEWYDETKKRVLTQTSSTAHIQEANPFRQYQHKSKKRKLSSRGLPGTTAPESEISPDTTFKQPRNDQSPLENQDKPLERLEVEHQLHMSAQKPEHLPSRSGATPDPEEQEGEIHRGQTNQATLRPRNLGDDISSHEPAGDGEHRFFLLRPRTSSSRQVLIPLDPSRTLAESLYGRTVLEFPTIYAFIGSKKQIPEGFMLEEEYLKQEGEEQKEFDELIQELDPEILRRLKEEGTSTGTARKEDVDSKKILDVLKQDLGGAL